MMAYTGEDVIKHLEDTLRKADIKRCESVAQRDLYPGLNSRKRRRNQLYFNRLVEEQK